MSKTETAVAEVLAALFGIAAETIRLESRIGDFPEWDSLGHLRLCMSLEERFGVSVPMERILELDSVSAIVSFLEKQGDRV